MLRYVLAALLILLLARALWRLVANALDAVTIRPSPGDPRRGIQMVRDPVCGTFVVPQRAVTLAERGRSLHFCSDACRDTYQARTA
jgi:YHS domain-containing protein